MIAAVDEPSTSDRPETSDPQSEDEESDCDIELSPPDDRYGWIVVGASFFAHLIGDGCYFSFGVIFAELLDYFHASRGKTAWVGSLFASMPLICGPIASSLTNRFGCRKTTMAGGFIAAVGCFSSAFVNSIDMLCLTFGIISGFGLALVFVPTIVVVAFYFEKQRSFATGVAVAGSGIGTFVFAPLTEILISMYSWKGAFLILSALLLNICVCGALFRPLVSKKAKRRVLTKEAGLHDSGQLLPDSSVSEFYQRDRRPQFIFQAYLDNGNCLYYENTTNSLIEFPTYLHKEFSSIIVELCKGEKNLHEVLRERHLLNKFRVSSDKTGLKQNQHWPMYPGVNDADQRNFNKPRMTHISPPPVTDSSMLPRPLPTRFQVRPKQMRHVNSLQNPPPRDSLHGERFRMISRKDIFYRGSLMRVGFMINNEYSSSCPDIYVRTGKKKTQTPTLGLWRNLQRVLDLTIVKSIIFDYFCLHCFFLQFSYDNSYIYIPDVATSSDMASAMEASFLISIIGIFSTIGQVIMGYMGDLKQVNTFHFYNITTATAGLLTLFVPLLDTFLLLAIYCAAYGLFISANYALTTIILVDLLGMERLTNAFGLVSLAEGLANLVGPPFAGWLCDISGSYDVTFLTSGAIIFLSGVMLFAVPCLRRLEKNSSTSAGSNTFAPSKSAERTQVGIEQRLLNGRICQPVISQVSASISYPNVKATS